MNVLHLLLICSQGWDEGKSALSSFDRQKNWFAKWKYKNFHPKWKDDRLCLAAIVRANLRYEIEPDSSNGELFRDLAKVIAGLPDAGAVRKAVDGFVWSEDLRKPILRNEEEIRSLIYSDKPKKNKNALHLEICCLAFFGCLPYETDYTVVGENQQSADLRSLFFDWCKQDFPVFSQHERQKYRNRYSAQIRSNLRDATPHAAAGPNWVDEEFHGNLLYKWWRCCTEEKFSGDLAGFPIEILPSVKKLELEDLTKLSGQGWLQLKNLKAVEIISLYVICEAPDLSVFSDLSDLVKLELHISLPKSTNRNPIDLSPLSTVGSLRHLTIMTEGLLLLGVETLKGLKLESLRLSGRKMSMIATDAASVRTELAKCFGGSR